MGSERGADAGNQAGTGGPRRGGRRGKAEVQSFDFSAFEGVPSGSAPGQSWSGALGDAGQSPATGGPGQQGQSQFREVSPMVNPVIINQAPAAPAATPAAPSREDTEGQVGGPGAGRAPRRSLLTLGLAETARKTLLGL